MQPILRSSFPSFSSFPQVEPIKETRVSHVTVKKPKRRKKQKEEHTDFYIHKTGDYDNVKYQSVYNYPVPQYKRCSLQLLGIPDWTISTRIQKYGRLVLYRKSQTGMQGDYRRIDKRYIDRYPVRIRPTETWTSSDFIRFGTVEEEAVEEAPDTQYQTKQAEIDRLLQQDQHNVDLWLQLVELQDKLLEDNRKESMKMRVAEKKIAILEKALSTNPQSQKLLSVYMSVYSQVSELDAVHSDWKQIMEQYRDSPSLWKDYLLFCSRIMGLGDVVGLYEEAIEALRPQQDEFVLLDIVYRCCLLLKNAGYQERAFAIYQALVELNLFLPADLRDADWEDKMEAMDVFWDMDVPRFGEPDALGWSHTQEETDILAPPEPDLEDFDMDSNGFLLKEAAKQFSQWLPKRVDVDEMDEDPFRTVLFQDVRGLLFTIKSDQAKQQLIHQFLAFLGLETQLAKPSDPLLLNDYTFKSDREQFFQKDGLLLGFPHCFYPQSLFQLYSIDGFQFVSDQKLANVYQQSHLSYFYTSSQLLWLTGLSHPESFEKLSKRALKQDPTNLLLWTTYAQLLIKHEKYQEARNVFGTALQMLSSLPQESRMDAVVLYSQWAYFELFHGDSETVKQILVGFVEGAQPKTVTGPVFLRALKIYDDVSKRFVSQTKNYGIQMERAVLVLFCKHLLIYLFQGEEELIKSAHATAETLRHQLLELFYQHISQILIFNATTKQFKPATLRNWLERGLSLFPTNAMLLSCYGWNEHRTRLENRVRRFVNEHAANALYNPSLWLLNLHFESYYGTQERARTVFYDALQHCPLTKSIYLMGLEVGLDENIQNMMQENDIRF
ncbi:NRDE-2, necessary for RNA interference-domain-containing protein [Gorgonomyces haynaldii]|nr:NRDE-2, necessary for RNA interference-domain-containing protein [Gorgonomyces haynaldii]